MKVTKSMLDADLQSTHTALSFVPAVLGRKWAIKLTNWLGARFRKPVNLDGLVVQERHIRSSDDEHDIRLLVFRPENHDDTLPCLVYIHGGGYIMGDPEQSKEIIQRFLETRPCVVIAPDYRKSFTRPYPAGFDDCCDTLMWAKEHAAELNIYPDRFMVAGHSAGGGLTAAVTLKARDTQEIDIAFQMPIYPMIDDTQPSDPARYIATPVWDTRMNRLGWSAYLAELIASGQEIPAYAAPARNTDYQGFPPTITFVGTMEPFYWETGAYVEALRGAGVEVAYEEYEGCYHAFEMLAGQAPISQRALAFTYDNFGAFYDRYVLGSAS
ncbi:MAG: alpha/beta hydrolase [Pseudomonadota bacterium]